MLNIWFCPYRSVSQAFSGTEGQESAAWCHRRWSGAARAAWQHKTLMKWLFIMVLHIRHTQDATSVKKVPWTTFGGKYSSVMYSHLPNLGKKKWCMKWSCGYFHPLSQGSVKSCDTGFQQSLEHTSSTLLLLPHVPHNRVRPMPTPRGLPRAISAVLCECGIAVFSVNIHGGKPLAGWPNQKISHQVLILGRSGSQFGQEKKPAS